VPKVTDEHVQARRRQILEAAFECFAEKGFHAATVQDICRKAGLSPGAVYGYFAGKEDIIAASCEEGVRADEALFARRDETVPEAIDRIIREGMSELTAPEADAWLRVRVELWAEAQGSPRVRESLVALYDRYRAWLAELLREGQERGEVRPEVDPDALARILIGLYQGLVIERTLRWGEDADPRQYVAAVRALVSGAVWTERQQPRGEVTDA
jgi:AcrR family transcriptional regulator